VPALLSRDAARPATIFTIHNLAYQGLFSRAAFVASGLPEQLWDYSALEFHGRPPLVLDLRSIDADFDHVVTIFKEFGW